MIINLKSPNLDYPFYPVGRPTFNAFCDHQTLIFPVWSYCPPPNYDIWPVKTAYRPGSSVGIAIDYGLEGPASNPGGDDIFRPSRPALGPTQPPVK